MSTQNEQERKNLEKQYTYEEPESNTTTQETPTPPETNPAANRQSQYTEEVKALAQQKAFKVEFLDGTSKMYIRRKVGLKEVVDSERLRQNMIQAKGTPLEIAKSIANFYWFASQIHLREGKTGKEMTEKDFDVVVFEDFKKVIDACEYVMLFGVPN